MTVKIESGIPVPRKQPKRSPLDAIFAAMRPGDSFVWKNANTPLMYAKRMGIRITTRKLNGDGYRVWLKAKPSTLLKAA